MIEWWWLWVPLAVLILNRLRGEEGGIGKWIILYVTILAGCITRDALMTANWALFMCSYALMPWSAMFSAINNTPPGRVDPWYSQWMQELASWIIGLIPLPSQPLPYWQIYGVIYGVIRASLMLPSIAIFVFLTHSLVPLAGLAMLLMGLVYYASWRILNISGLHDFDIPLAECAMGWLIGTYLLITHAAQSAHEWTLVIKWSFPWM